MRQSWQTLQYNKYWVSSQIFKKARQKKGISIAHFWWWESQDIVKKLYLKDIFLFIYDVWKLADISIDFPNSRHDVDHFKVRAIVAIEF